MSVRTSSGVSTCDVHSDDPQYYTIFTTIDVCEKGDVFSPRRSNFDIIMHMVSLRGSPVYIGCLLYTSPSPRDRQKSRMPSSA